MKINLSSRKERLSIITPIYDSLGLVNPYLQKEKKILQNLCYDSLGCVEKIPENVEREWEYWKKKLLHLKHIQIDRCLKPSYGYEDIVEVSLHHFSDTSESGYGQCSYIRFVTRDKKIHCCLQIGKARVSPKTFVKNGINSSCTFYKSCKSVQERIIFECWQRDILDRQSSSVGLHRE